MTTTINKQKVLHHFFTHLKKSSGVTEPEARPVLEQFVYGICRENASREQADRAFKNLSDRFFDWNEIRVSSPRELEEVMDDLPQAEQRAERIISFLQEVFEATFSYDLEALHKKGVKLAGKALQRYQAANEFVIAWVLQQALDGHAVPLDPAILRVVRRLGLIENEVADHEAIRTSLEHLVPKAKGPLFTELALYVASEYCAEDDPSCRSCPIASECPSAQEFTREPVVAARTARSKPR